MSNEAQQDPIKMLTERHDKMAKEFEMFKQLPPEEAKQYIIVRMEEQLKMSLKQIAYLERQRKK